MLVASGWIYPTDSSINVAIAQAGIAPRGLSLEAQHTDGSWRVVQRRPRVPGREEQDDPDRLERGDRGARRIRLRTNLEIYWDALQLGSRAASPVKTTRIAGIDRASSGIAASHTPSRRAAMRRRRRSTIGWPRLLSAGAT